MVYLDLVGVMILLLPQGKLSSLLSIHLTVIVIKLVMLSFSFALLCFPLPLSFDRVLVLHPQVGV